MLILKKKVSLEILWISYYDIVYHLENVEMTPELYDDLTNFSFDNLWDVDIRMSHESPRANIHNFPPAILECLKMLVCYHIYSVGLCPMPIYSMMQPSTEADRISRTLQVDFDKILCNVLEKHHSFPGFALVLGGLLQSIMNIKECLSSWNDSISASGPSARRGAYP